MNKRYMGWLITGLVVALFFIGQARAQTRLYWDINGNIIATESQANYNQRAELSRQINDYASRRSGMPSSATVSGGMATMERAATLEVGAGSGMGSAVKVALRDVVTSPVSSLGKGLVNVARTTPAGLAGGIAASLLLDAGISYLNGQWTKSGTPEQAPNGVPYSSSLYTGTNYVGPNGQTGASYYGSPEVICPKVAEYSPGVKTIYLGYTVNSSTISCNVQRIDNGVQFAWTVQKYTTGCGTGATLQVSTGQCLPAGYVPAQGSTPATDAQIESAITSGINAKPQIAMDVLKNIYDNGGWVPADVADSAGWTLPSTPVKGKPSSSTTNSTAPNGDSLTTTSTSTPTLNLGTTGNTLGNNTLTYNVTNNTTTTVTNNTTGQTSTSTGTEDPPITFQDSAMPEVPKLYTQKYPDGLAGVWRNSAPDVKSTDFYQGVKAMFPSFGAGQCPLWRMTFNLGKPGNFGTGDLTVPCWIFQALGLVILATAAFTARKIIF